MFDELELLKFQINEETEMFSGDLPVLVFINKENGQYIDHFIEGDNSRMPPNIIQQTTHGLKLLKCTLEDLRQAIVNECECRNM